MSNGGINLIAIEIDRYASKKSTQTAMYWQLNINSHVV